MGADVRRNSADGLMEIVSQGTSVEEPAITRLLQEALITGVGLELRHPSFVLGERCEFGQPVHLGEGTSDRTGYPDVHPGEGCVDVGSDLDGPSESGHLLAGLRTAWT